MRIGVAATPIVALPVLNWLASSSHEIACVITQPDRPSGRGQEISASPVAKWAISNGFHILRPESPHDLVGHIEDLDCVITIGYGIFLPEEILVLPRHGFLNLHFSLLPAYRGAAPVQRAIENGETISGVTVFALDKGMDTGPIYTSAQLAIDPTWRTGELMEALAQMGPLVVDAALSAIANGVLPQKQVGISSPAPKISKREAEINWSQSADEILCKVRAFYPAPGAWSTWDGAGFKLTRAKISQGELSIGEIAIIDGDVVVGCGSKTALSLLTVVPAGKKEMKAEDWARGARLSPGAHFG